MWYLLGAYEINDWVGQGTYKWDSWEPESLACLICLDERANCQGISNVFTWPTIHNLDRPSNFTVAVQC